MPAASVESASTAARAASRNAALSSPGSTRSGVPNRAVQVIGTISMLPLGRMRAEIVEIDRHQLDVGKAGWPDGRCRS